jgi:putative IMPACT (imprinted ancient) family translation regulator
MLFSDTYMTLAAPAEGVFKDKGSKFYAFAYPVHSEDEVKQYINQLKKEHAAANHHCYAFVLGFDQSIQKANDDREHSKSQ